MHFRFLEYFIAISQFGINLNVSFCSCSVNYVQIVTERFTLDL